MKFPKVLMWDAAFDYVRLTSKAGVDENGTDVLYRLAARSCVARRLEGEVELKPWFWQGYYGEVGPGVAYGSREDGFILQASGPAADEVRGLALPFDNVPRCDVAVTVWYEQDGCASIGDYATISRRFSASKGSTGWKVVHIDGGGDGSTTYIGSRTSDRYIRIYDKWRESKGDEDYKFAIRYEVEYKGDAAKEVWTGVHRTTPGRAWLAGVVSSEARRRGVFLPKLDTEMLAAAPVVPKVKTSTDKRLAWLRNQVAPSVARLLTDGVSRDTILQELGLANRE